MMVARKILPMNATIPPGVVVCVRSPLLQEKENFLSERLLIGSGSFSLSWARRAWTYPLVLAGRTLFRLTPDIAVGERREHVSKEFAREHEGEVEWRFDEDGEHRPFIRVPIPLTLRERLLNRLNRMARRLMHVRIDWQTAQLSTLIIRDIRIAGVSQIRASGDLPGDLFSCSSIDNFVNFQACPAGEQIEIDVANTGRRECKLVMAIVGTVRS